MLSPESGARRSPQQLATLVFAVLGVLVVGALVLWVLPAVLTRQPSVGMSSAERLKAANDARGPVIAFLVAVGAGATSWFTARSYQLSREGQVTDRYTKAVGQLGEVQPSVRVGGIYALERIGHDSARDRTTIIYVLGAFIREHSKVGQRSPDADLPEDVATAIRVAGRLLARSTTILNLRGADLRNADLSGLPPAQVWLDGSNLAGARLPGTTQ